jgi:hypothetical protein
MSPGCCGWFKQAKHWAIEHGRAHAQGMCRRTVVRPLEAQEMSGLGCNCLSPLLIFACPRRARQTRGALQVNPATTRQPLHDPDFRKGRRAGWHVPTGNVH